MKLKFSKGNAKLGKAIHTFSLPAGHTCPFALDCKAKVILNKNKRTLIDGPKARFRCFSATSEVFYPKVYEARQHNLELIRAARGVSKITSLIESSLPSRCEYLRLHVSGDFFNQTYFDAWLRVARANTGVLFYAYTKSLPFWTNRLGLIPPNMVLTASMGGRHDDIIDKYDLKYAKVVFSEDEANSLNLPIDHDDSHAMAPEGNFALLLHGVQPKGSEASKAFAALKGFSSYRR